MQDRREVNLWPDVPVAGVTHSNPDGTQRQAVLKACEPGEELRLRPEPENPHDPNAVAVLRQSGAQLGYLPREYAERVVRGSTEDCGYGVFLTRVVGGTAAAPSLGARLLLIEASPDVSQDEVRRHLEERGYFSEKSHPEQGPPRPL